jgi:hypothetical protein
MFFHSNDGKKIGFKISKSYFDNIVKNHILNINLGIVDENNKPILSTTIEEPLLVTLEHEIIHMLMYLTQNNKYNDLSKVKTGHTPIFKKLIYNIFGHIAIKHKLYLGDAKEIENIKNKIKLGMFVKDIKNNSQGYVVKMKNDSVVLYDPSKNIKNRYFGSLYNNLVIDENIEPIDIESVYSKLKKNTKINFEGNDYVIQKINKSNMVLIDDRGRNWVFPVIRMLELTII